MASVRSSGDTGAPVILLWALEQSTDMFDPGGQIEHTCACISSAGESATKKKLEVQSAEADEKSTPMVCE